ncbi:glucose 1-dehydrogenase [Pseudomonas linyingensis]|uniref:Glucose 1-dehydrogenase n=1 Tax=Pseudomonas linyingensis TaxID=915471 RepID=A0A1H7BGT5_9PSED|nr:glucose 1-dehydrogenase [Pseudomonas linyingensis]SEJ76708.1 glucose 1-dehydrogenase [Pseudomonas linyingensis]
MTARVLEGKVAIVTGAAMGMGAATAQLFAEAGAKVVVADMNEDMGLTLVAEIERAGGQALFQRCNVAVAADVEALVQATVAHFGRLDVAVNNAAVSPDTKPLAEMDEDEFDKVIAVDLKGVALCLKYQLSQMIRQGGGGAIVNIGSVSSFRPQPNNGVYVAAKHGVVGLSKVAALENGVHGIRVNTVAPGAIDTLMLRGALERMGASEADYAPQLSLLGRFGQPREVAQASLWLASEQSSYVTGTTIHVDAGYTNR